MGFSLVAAAAIIGVSSLMVIELLTGAVLPTLSEVNDSYDDMKNRAINQVQTDINTTAIYTIPNGSNYDLNITIENIGSITLETDHFNILINGTNRQFNCSHSYLYPERKIYFTVNNLSGTGTKRLKVITNNGISDYYEYTV